MASSILTHLAAFVCFCVRSQKAVYTLPDNTQTAETSHLTHMRLRTATKKLHSASLALKEINALPPTLFCA